LVLVSMLMIVVANPDEHVGSFEFAPGVAL
jgi:hypothetical protein